MIVDANCGDILASSLAGPLAGSALDGSPCVDWLEDLQQRGRRALSGLPLPSRKSEQWRYLSLRGLAEGGFRLPSAEDEAPSALASLQIRLAGGRIAAMPASLPAGLQILPLRSANPEQRQRIRSLLEEITEGTIEGGGKQGRDERDGRESKETQQPFELLHASAMSDGLIIELAPGARLPEPLRIYHCRVKPGNAAFHSIFVHCAEGAQMTLIEEEEDSPDGHLLSVLRHLHLEDGASLRHAQLQANAGGWRLATDKIEQAKDSLYHFREYASGAALRSRNLAVSLNGPGASADIAGAGFASENQQLASHYRVCHAAGGARSQTLFKGLASDKGRSVFSGHIVIDPDAQDSVADLHNPNLLFSREAEIDARPILEIYADEVQCSHGCTVGQPDPDALFYLRSRGIPEMLARQMIALAFVDSILNEMPSELDYGELRRQLAERLQG